MVRAAENVAAARKDKMTLDTQQHEAPPAADHARLVAEGSPLHRKPIVLVGLMGAGKTTVGRRLAARLGLPFIDSDTEIERAAGLTITEIFEKHGEPEFRAGEHRVIARLLRNGGQILATGGGAFILDHTRALIKEQALTIWLRADLDVLMRRVSKRNNRPLLNRLEGGRNPRDIMRELMDKRYPVYAQADITIDSLEGPHDTVVDEVLARLDEYCDAHRGDAA